MSFKYILQSHHLSVRVFVLSSAMKKLLIFMQSDLSDFSLKTFWFSVLLKKVSLPRNYKTLPQTPEQNCIKLGFNLESFVFMMLCSSIAGGSQLQPIASLPKQHFWNLVTLICLYIIYSCLCTTTAYFQQSPCDSYRLKYFIFLLFTEKVCHHLHVKSLNVSPFFQIPFYFYR